MITPSVIQTNRSPMSSAVAGALPWNGAPSHSVLFRSSVSTYHQPSSRPAIYDSAYQRMLIGP